MNLPSYKEYYPVILQNAKKSRTADEYLEFAKHYFGLTSEQMEIRNPSGEQTVRNRLRWAIHYLRRAGLMQRSSRGHFIITERGLGVLKKPPKKV